MRWGRPGRPEDVQPDPTNALRQPRDRFARLFLCAGLIALPHLALAQEGLLRPDAPAVRRVEATDAQRDSLVRMARSQLGRRYRFGGTTPAGFDCSGFLRYVMRAMGRDLPRTAAEQARVGTEVPRDVRFLRPGDILTFGRGNRVTHVGVYVGNGRFIHASSGAGRIVESDLDRPQSHLVRAWYGVRRLLAERDSGQSVAVNTQPVNSSAPKQ